MINQGLIGKFSQSLIHKYLWLDW